MPGVAASESTKDFVVQSTHSCVDMSMVALSWRVFVQLEWFTRICWWLWVARTGSEDWESGLHWLASTNDENVGWRLLAKTSIGQWQFQVKLQLSVHPCRTCKIQWHNQNWNACIEFPRHVLSRHCTSLWKIPWISLRKVEKGSNLVKWNGKGRTESGFKWCHDFLICTTTCPFEGETLEHKPLSPWGIFLTIALLFVNIKSIVDNCHLAAHLWRVVSMICSQGTHSACVLLGKAHCDMPAVCDDAFSECLDGALILRRAWTNFHMDQLLVHPNSHPERCSLDHSFECRTGWHTDRLTALANSCSRIFHWLFMQSRQWTIVIDAWQNLAQNCQMIQQNSTLVINCKLHSSFLLFVSAQPVIVVHGKQGTQMKTLGGFLFRRKPSLQLLVGPCKWHGMEIKRKLN